MLSGLGKGYYKFEKPDCFSIKGFLHESMFEVRFKKEVLDLTTDFLYALMYYYRDGKPDFETLSKRDTAIVERVKAYLYGNKA